MSLDPRRPSRAATLLLALVLGVAGCTGDDSGSEADPGPSSGSATAEPLVTTARAGVVTGRLPAERRRLVVREVVAVVDRWVDAAYVSGEYPRRDFDDAWPGFTPGAREDAAADRQLTSNAGVGADVEAVTATRRRVVVDVLAAGGRAVGATARVDLGLRLEGEAVRTDRIRGRLLLTPGPRGWAVFGYDLSRGPAGGSGRQDREDERGDRGRKNR